MIGNASELDLGVHPLTASRRLAECLRREGLNVVEEDASSVDYLPYDKTSGVAWLIEDENDAKEIARRMLAAGVRVELIEVD